MITKEQLDLLYRDADAAEDAYQTALGTEHTSLMSRYQPALLSPRIRALKQASDTALLRRSNGSRAYERQMT
jgi:hypothetical protein